MNKQERERSKREREKIRKRRLWIAKRLTGCAAVILVLILLVSFIKSLFPQEENVLPAQANAVPAPESSVGISVGQPSASPEPTASPEPQGYQQLSDPFLVLVNGEVPLPKDWQVDLVPVTEGSDVQVDRKIYDALNDMWRAASDSGAVLWIASGYRSIEDQSGILAQAIQNRMSQQDMSEEEAQEDALRTIQKPGYSEHHTGLVIDFNNVENDFEGTEAYAWLSQHAADYGFVQRYKKDKVQYTGIDNESWHYRYVGPEHAKEMERLNMCLEEYVEYLKENGQS